MVLCAIVGCGQKSGQRKAISFYRIPAIITHQGEQTEELTRERRMRWISAISRDDLTESKLQTERICMRHFVSQEPSRTWDRYNVDWVPTLFLGHKKNGDASKDEEAVATRAERAKRLRRSAIERQEYEAAKKRRALNDSGKPVAQINFCTVEGEPLEGEDTDRVEGTESELNDEIIADELESVQSNGTHTETMTDSATQTEEWDLVDSAIQTEECNYLFPTMPTESVVDSATQTEEFDYLFHSGNRYSPPDRDYFDTDEKVHFYTGLPTKGVLMSTFDHVAPYVQRRATALNNFQEFVLVLMKLRLNIPFQDLAYRFQVTVSTISRIFACWMTVMDICLFWLIFWPEREQLWKTMPMCHQYSFGKKVTVIIDFFEVFIEKPSNLLAHAQTFSNYKHHNTIKILIAIAPQGFIAFVSEAWGGDVVMADRGFTVTESVGMKQAQLVIPAFTKGKEQLDPVDVKKTRGIANVQIHVERVIGLLRTKYTILEGILPCDFLVSTLHGPPIIDSII